MAEFLRNGSLVAPFGSANGSHRAYFVVRSRRAEHNPDAQDFMRWLWTEAELMALAASS